MKTDIGEIAKARKSAYTLLKYKDRTSKEMQNRLKAKGFSEDICVNVITELQKLGYINDTRLANTLAQNILQFKPAGTRFIRSKLYSRGIPFDTANSVISAVEKDYDENDCAYKLAVIRMKRLRGEEPRNAKQKLYAFLARRCFSHEAISDTLNRIFKNEIE